MFQRRMILVANRLQNSQLHAPQLFSKKKRQQQPTDENQTPASQNDDDDDDVQGHTNEGAITTERINNIRSIPQPTTKIDFDTIALHLRKKSLNHQQRTQSLLNKLRRHFIYVVFLLYLLVGTLFYMFDPNNAVHGILAYYQAITIGFSVGLGTKDPNFVPNVWFSSLYILCGAAIIAVMLTVAGNQVEEAASMSMFESLQRRESYENQMSRDKPLKVRLYAFLAYNSAYLMSILVWILWMVFIVTWALILVDKWDYSEAQYFAVSLCSSAGSFSLPEGSSDLAYGLAGVSMMIGVPLMAMGVTSIITMCWQGHRFQKVKLAAWDDVTQEELELLNELGVVEIGEGEKLTKGGFLLLGLLRMGQEVGVMKYLADAFDAIEDRGGVIIREKSEGNNLDGNGYYSKHAHAYVCHKHSKDEIDEMQDFTSITSHEASTATSLLSKTSTAVSNSKPTSGANDRLWSTSVGVDSTTRRFSGLSEILSGGSAGNNECLGPTDEDLTNTERQANDSDIGTVPSRLDSDVGTTKRVKPKDTWESNKAPND